MNTQLFESDAFTIAPTGEVKNVLPKNGKIFTLNECD